VVGVSWEDAKAFCDWLTKKQRKAGKLRSDQSYRLPTDAEWSVAVGLPNESGSTPKEKDGKIKDVYPWGTEWPPPSGAGNYGGSEAHDGKWPNWSTDGYPRTSPVGSFKANRFGLYDMGGNVWQWCEDWYDESKTLRVLRGSSWGGIQPDHLLSSCRYSRMPDDRNARYGFRCVVALSAASSP
jgi:formylglycine-generating enzyme required for sulfatase activity